MTLYPQCLASAQVAGPRPCRPASPQHQSWWPLPLRCLYVRTAHNGYWYGSRDASSTQQTCLQWYALPYENSFVRRHSPYCCCSGPIIAVIVYCGAKYTLARETDDRPTAADIQCITGICNCSLYTRVLVLLLSNTHKPPAAVTTAATPYRCQRDIAIGMVRQRHKEATAAVHKHCCGRNSEIDGHSTPPLVLSWADCCSAVWVVIKQRITSRGELLVCARPSCSTDLL